MSNLTKRYGEAEALRGIDLEVHAGEAVFDIWITLVCREGDEVVAKIDAERDAFRRRNLLPAVAIAEPMPMQPGSPRSDPDLTGRFVYCQIVDLPRGAIGNERRRFDRRRG